VAVSGEGDAVIYDRKTVWPSDFEQPPLINVDRRYCFAKNLSCADFSGVDMRRSNLSGVDLDHADLSASILVEADLSFSDLREADLSGANLSGADLFGSDLDGANLAAVIFDDETDWPDGFDPGPTAIRGP